MLFSVAKRSLISRRKTAILTLLSLTISLIVLFTVEHVRLQAKESFNRTISSTDLIVGAPSGQLNLLLYTVFRIGTPTNNIDIASFEAIKNNALVEWSIPFSLGDSHRGFRVIGTSQAYFQHFKYGDKRPLEVKQGKPFNTLFETVIGADVARQLGYKVGDKIVVAHGIGNTSFTKHDKSPFVISGILAPTGTPVDKTVHVSLEAIEAIHLPPSQLKQLVDDPASLSLKPKSITAVLVGLTSKFATFKLQRDLNNYPDDRLMAILPGVAMAELWSLVGTIEKVLQVIAALVLISALFGLSTMLLASMNERKTEIAVLRVLGAGPSKIMLLILLEALLMSFSAIVISTVAITLGLFALKEWLAATYGLFLSTQIFTAEILFLALGVLVATVITAAIPCFEAYKTALHRRLA